MMKHSVKMLVPHFRVTYPLAVSMLLLVKFRQGHMASQQGDDPTSHLVFLQR